MEQIFLYDLRRYIFFLAVAHIPLPAKCIQNTTIILSLNTHKPSSPGPASSVYAERGRKAGVCVCVCITAVHPPSS